MRGIGIDSRLGRGGKVGKGSGKGEKGVGC